MRAYFYLSTVARGWLAWIGTRFIFLKDMLNWFFSTLETALALTSWFSTDEAMLYT